MAAKKDDVSARLDMIEKKIDFILSNINRVKKEEEIIEEEEEKVERDEKKIKAQVSKSISLEKKRDEARKWEEGIRFACIYKTLGDKGGLHCEKTKGDCLFEKCPVR